MKNKPSNRFTASIFSLLTIFLVGWSGILAAQVTLPAILTDNMVLQQNFDAPVWGWAAPGTEVVVSGSWSRMPAEKAVADADGQWMVRLKTTEAGGPYQININDQIIKNVMLGEVWICSGQSNMQWSLEESENAEPEIKSALYPSMRLFYVARDHADEPSKDCYGHWEPCSPANARFFSAVAYYFGKELLRELDVPIGLIHVSFGGSPARAWINKNVLLSTPEGRYYIKKQEERNDALSVGILPRDHRSPASLYNAMLRPLIPYGIKGAIWYQGEANIKEHHMYKDLLNTMINNWRDEWGQGNFPFYYVQLAPFNYSKEIRGAALRDAQREALFIPNTGMAVTMDIGNPDDIHPTNKKDVGHRLALWALAKTYGNESLVCSGPIYHSMDVDGGKISLTFDHIGSGLICKGKELDCFTIAGADKIFHPAKATIENDRVSVSSDIVNDPIAVRFAFANTDEPNFFNKEGLPASTFRTDDWKIITKTVPITSKYNEQEQGFQISIRKHKNLEVRYTMDGSEPGINSEIYTKPFITHHNGTVKAKAIVGGEPSMVTSEIKIVRHLATGKKLSYLKRFNKKYDAGGEMGLVNSVFGSTDFKDGNWQGFQGDNLEVVIDMGDPLMVSSVRINCLQIVNSWIVLPKEVIIYSSEDGTTFREIGRVQNEIPAGNTKEMIRELEVVCKSTETRHLKVLAKNYGPLPEWHRGAGKNAWLFVDEIIVE